MLISKKIFLNFFLFTALLFSQNQPVEPSPTKLFNLIDRKPLVTYSLIAHSSYVFYTQYQWWWKGESKPFTIQYEGFLNDYSYGVDKFGHFYISYGQFLGTYELMRWSGYDENSSIMVGAAISTFHALTLELADGFLRYKFAPDDLLFNSLGIAYAALQIKNPFLKNFTFKWSYFPSHAKIIDETVDITNDYDGHIYWLSSDIHNLLPESYRKYWPKYLNLALGYGAINVYYGSTDPFKRKFVIGLDYNLLALPLEGEVWDLVKGIVDRIHYPAPAIRIIEDKPAEFKPFILN